jgi:hypothetical protein
MFNPLTPIIAEQHRDNLLERARKRRSLAAVRKSSPSLKERLCVGIGGFLISSGLRLQAPYQPALPARPETLQPGR